LVRSAEAIAPVLSRSREQSVGQSILQSIQATHDTVATNTNLGIVLLLAPLAKVPAEVSLREGITEVLELLSLADSVDVFKAILLAKPGGLGQASEQDVRASPTLPLRAVMALAADRDLIARQYRDAYHDVFTLALPTLLAEVSRGLDLESAVVWTHVTLMARFPDSLIERKYGCDVARQVQDRASVALAEKSNEALGTLDAWLVERRLNPGTTADLIAATLFVALRERLI
jgi:triphosphoribosyl-dephospho-CoA synthase